MCAASTSGAPLVNTKRPEDCSAIREHSTITLIRFNAEEKGYLCLTLTTIPFPGCSTQQRDEEDDEAEEAELLRLMSALFKAASLHRIMKGVELNKSSMMISGIR